MVTTYGQFDPAVPSIELSPAVSYVRAGESIELSARILGTSDRNVTWSTTGGTLTGTAGESRTFRAGVAGEYVVTASLAGGLRAEARVIARESTGGGGYWRFEPGSPVRDEFGDATLTPAGNPGPSPVQLPATGPGSAFPRTGSFASNQGATSMGGGRYTVSLPVSPTFTIETFVHFRTLNGSFGKILAGYAADANTTPWNLQVRLDGFRSTLRGELVMSSFVPGSNWFAPSGITVQAGRDYFIAVSLATTGRVTFYVTDLTAGTTITRSVDLGPVVVASSPNGFAIGDTFLGDFDFEIDGVIDEVRLTPRVLGPNELLWPAP